MEPTINSRAVLVFHGEVEDLPVRITIPRARLDLTPQTAADGMAAIVAAGAVMTADGKPTGAKSAKLVSVERRRLV